LSVSTALELHCHTDVLLLLLLLSLHGGRCAAGVMLCVMLIGRFPFEGIEMSNATNLEEVSAHVRRQSQQRRLPAAAAAAAALFVTVSARSPHHVMPACGQTSRHSAGQVLSGGSAGVVCVCPQGAGPVGVSGVDAGVDALLPLALVLAAGLAAAAEPEVDRQPAHRARLRHAVSGLHRPAGQDV